MATPTTTSGRRKRLTGEARRETILEAARAEFAATGDIGATTTKSIAKRVGVSEAMIYRYFESKDELYLEAVVEPLQAIVERTVAEVEAFPESVTDQEQLSLSTDFFEEILETMRDSLPLIGLVLFGEPATAENFYARCWKPSLDRLSNAWSDYYRRKGVEAFPSTDVAARMMFGVCMMCALDARYAEPEDRRALAESISKAAFGGMWLRESEV